MSSRIVFTSRPPKIAAIGALFFIGATLFCTVLFSLALVEAKVEDKSQTALAQPQPTLIPSAQTAATVFLPLIAHESINHIVAHQEAPPARVMASSDHSGHSTTPPPTANSYTYVADEGGFLDQYLGRSEMANGLLTFVFTTTVPVVPTTSYLNQDGSLTGIGLDWMYRFHKLSRRSYL